MTPDPDHDLEQLLEEEPFVRALAHKLAFGDADDVVQQTWLRAMQRPQAAIAEPRRWLARVVHRLANNLRRTDRRRQRHHAQVPLPDGVPTSAELIEREERRRTLVTAVDALPPSQRSVVLLRYFEGLPPRAIGERLGLPAATVSTLLSRGLATLRQRLDRQLDGDRRAWLLPLCPFSSVRPLPMAAAPKPVMPALMTGIVAMTMKIKLVAALAVVIVAAGALVLWQQRETPPALPHDQLSDAGPVPPATGGIESDTPGIAVDQPVNERQAALQAATETAILVEVVWATDGKPAADVTVKLYRRGGNALFDRPQGRTDERGAIAFVGLAPGRYTPLCDRGTGRFGKPIELAAGQRAEVRLEIPVGLTARGRVVDAAGLPVPDADLIVADWGGGSTTWLGISAADGTFALRGVATTCHLGARKAGYRPSSLRTFTTEEGAEVEFTIVLERGGGAITGTVYAPNGQPIAKAAVRAGTKEQNNHKLPDGGRAMGPQPEEVQTDERGRFAFLSVVSGAVPIAVRAPGLAPWARNVTVDDGTTVDVDVHLLPGASVLGVVNSEQGEPLGDVDIRVGGWDDYVRGRTRSDADGTFRLDGLGIGALEAVAKHDDHGETKSSLDLVAGVEQRWDPVLSSGLQLRGRVLDHEGKPVARVMLDGQPDSWRTGDRWFGNANSDADGRFTMPNCLPGRTIRITARRKSVFPEVTLERVTVGPDELIIRLPEPAWVHIEGTVRGADGELLANVNLSPNLQESRSGTPVETVDPTTGAFAIGPYPPGRYTLNVSADGYPRLRLERALGPNETWHTGELRLVRGGTLAVQVVSDAIDAKYTASIYNASGDWLAPVQLERGAGSSEPLVPGDYELMVSGAKGTAVLPFSIRAGLETRLDAPLSNGHEVTLTCENADGTALSGAVRIVVRHPDGRTAWRGSAWPRDDACTTSFWLVPGSYRVEATWRESAAAGEFRVVGATTHALTLAPR